MLHQFPTSESGRFPNYRTAVARLRDRDFNLGVTRRDRISNRYRCFVKEAKGVRVQSGEYSGLNIRLNSGFKYSGCRVWKWQAGGLEEYQRGDLR